VLITLVPLDRPNAKGEAWRVIDKRASVRFSSRPGPWWLVVRAGRPAEDLAAQWIHALMDEQYKTMPGTPG